MIHHYLLTRFNLALWRENKTGEAIDRKEWLVRRMQLFETYCLPSVQGQTCRDFCWVLLVDENTPAEYRDRILKYRAACQQIKIVGVKAAYAVHFADIFRQVVQADLQKNGCRADDLCLTTYLDNDDSISCHFVERVQTECLAFHLLPQEKRFLSFDYGLQLFTEMNHLATRILYPNNHFLTLAECIPSASLSPSEGELSGIRTCYGYGSHFLLEKQKLATVHHVKDAMRPMWIEVIHEGNVDNDVKMTLDTHFVKDKDLLRRDFSLQMEVGTIQRMTFVCRALAQGWRRLKNKFTDR